ncbi:MULTISPECIES: polysaccharide deacetylase family protein [unclassified Thioalkalivibrio]|uniref:polysaccharide deacetylase family protein n=1 Tax=unclassified Thioalkalivibrio TaxID=2621013 RepID=UPI0009DA8681|nr:MULTISPECIES: polysaccharide deacetylase family protein [unclassified Thioalkalivibrio]
MSKPPGKPRRQCILRFDVDTELCLREGVPALEAIARRHETPLSLFVNPGRAIDRGALFKEALRGFSGQSTTRPPDRPPALSARDKLGMRETGRLLLNNPPTLAQHAGTIRRLAGSGHYIGLHGGHNHAAWQRHAYSWPEDRVRREVDWGRQQLQEAANQPVTGFASPGWTSPENLPDILIQKGFRVLADERSERCPYPHETTHGQILSVPNTLAGEPGGTGYFESLRFRFGKDEQAARNEIDSALETAQPYLCLYDHPFFVGRHAVELFSHLVTRLLALGYEIVTPDNFVIPEVGESQSQ